MKLRVVRGENTGQIFFLEKTGFRIGRMGDNDFVIPEAGVSRYHCALSYSEDSWWVENMSGNGILVNGRKVAVKVQVFAGDEITVSDVVVKLQNDEDGIDAVSGTPVFNEEAVEEELAAENGGHEDATGELEPGDEPKSGGHGVKGAVALGIAVVAVVALGIAVYALWPSVMSLAGAGDDAQKTETAAVAEEPQKAEEQPETVEEKAAENHTRGESLLAKGADVAKPMVEAQDDGEVAPPAVKAVKDAVDAAKADDADEDEDADDDEKPKAAGVKKTETQEDDDEDAAEEPAKDRKASRAAGLLVIQSEPMGADVLLDGRSVGKSPVLIQSVSDGQHSVELAKPGYERLTRLIDYPDELPSEPYRLVQRVGTLYVTSEPAGASVREGRQILGTTPLLVEKLQPGKHEFVLEHPACASQKVAVEMTASKGETVSVAMQQQLGGLDIVTMPAGCQVLVDGVLMGVTEQDDEKAMSRPLSIQKLLAGNCMIRIQHPQTGLYENDVLAIPKGRSLTKRFYLWVPTHKITLMDGRTVIGMMLRKTDDKIDIMNAGNRGESFIIQECTEVKELTAAEQRDALKNKASLREASGEQSVKSVLSVSVEEFFQRAKMPLFKDQYKGKRLCVTGDVTARFKNPKGIPVVQFGKQLRCLMLPATTDEDFKQIGSYDKQGVEISLRGIYDGTDKEGVHILRNCVLLPFAD